MCSTLMWNDVNVCGCSMGLKILARDLSEMWKSLESESVMMVVETLMCWECRYT